jgi:hypothetical protein
VFILINGSVSFVGDRQKAEAKEAKAREKQAERERLQNVRHPLDDLDVPQPTELAVGQPPCTTTLGPQSFCDAALVRACLVFPFLFSGCAGWLDRLWSL